MTETIIGIILLILGIISISLAAICIFMPKTLGIQVLYCKLFDRKSYNAYNEIMSADKVFFVGIKDFAMAIAEKRAEISYEEFDHSFEFSENSFYYVTMSNGGYGLYKGTDCVLTDFYKLMMDEIKTLKKF